MSERKKMKKRGQETQSAIAAEIKPSKLEYAVAHYMKNKVPTKKTKFLNHQVNFFNANRAVDVLLDSPWASGTEVIFTDRASVVKFCNKLLQHKFFHRAKKIPVTDKDLSPKELKKKKKKEKEEKPPSKKKEKNENDEAKVDEQSNNEQEEAKDKDSKKKKPKIKLDMHLNQIFVDGSEAYVWMYDPIPFWYYIAGACLLFAAIAICLFPLWPPSVRQGVYYLSIAAAGFLGVILGLAVLRFIIFVIIWTLSLGRHHFWILPNLTEDVGFFASFWPLYYYEYKGSSSKGSSSKKKASKKEAHSNETERQSRKSDGDEAFDSQSAAETDADKNVEDCQEHSAAASDSDRSNPNSESCRQEEMDQDD